MPVDFYPVEEEQQAAPEQDQSQGVSFYPAEDLVKFSLGQALNNPLFGAIFNPAVGMASEGARQQASLDRIPIPPQDMEQPTSPSDIVGAMPASIANQEVSEAIRQAYQPKIEAPGFLQDLKMRASQLPVIGPAFTPTELPFQTREQAIGVDRPQGILEGIREGSTRAIAPLATPENIGLMVGTGGLSAVLKAKEMAGAAEVIQRLLSGYFGGEALNAAREQYPEIFAPGRTLPERVSTAIQTLGSGAIAAGALTHAATGDINAPQERLIEESRQREYPGVGKIGTATETGGGNRAQPTARLEEKTSVPLNIIDPHGLLSDEGKQHFQDAANAVGVGGDVEIHPDYLTDQRGRALPNTVALADVPVPDANGNFVKPGRIHFSNKALNEVMDTLAQRGVSIEDAKNLLQSYMSEEIQHSFTLKSEAETYHDSMTPLERTLRERAYKGGQVFDMTKDQLGAEFLRQDWQYLNGHTPAEIAEQLGRKRFTTQSLLTIARIIQRMREWFGTKAAEGGRSIMQATIDRMTKNVEAAGKAIGMEESPFTSDTRASIRRTETDEGGKEEPKFDKVETQPAEGGATRLTYYDRGKEVGNALLAGKAMVSIGVQEPLRRQGYGKAILEDLRKRGGSYSVEGSPEGRALMKSSGMVETEPGRFEFGASKEFPPLLPGERLVTVQRGDGSTYTASFGDKYWEIGGKRMASIAKAVGDSWSHGILKPDEKIIEREPARASIRRGETEEEKTVVPSDVFQTKRKTLRGKTEEIKQPVYNDLSMGHNLGPVALGKMLTDDAGESGRKTVSETRRVTVLQDKRTGQVEMVSTYRDGRRGPVLLDPETGKSKKLTEVLPRYRPIASVLLQEPVKDFRQSFDNAADYEQRFGKEARRASQPSMAPEPRVEGHQYIPGVYGSPEPITPLEAGSIRDHILNEVGKFDSPDDVKASWDALHEDSKPLVLNAYRKLAEQLEKVNPENTPAEEILRQLQENIYETHTKSPTKEEFKRGILAQGGPEAREAFQAQPQQATFYEASTTPEQPGRAAIRRNDPATDRTPRRRLTVDLIGRLFGQDAAEATDAVLRKAAGEALPKIMSMSREAGNAVIRFASSAIAAPHMARSMTREVLGDKWNDEAFRQKLGSVLVEDRLRAIKQSFNQQGDVAKANAVNSLVGPDKPFNTEADFQASLADPEIRDAIQRHKDTVQDVAKQYHETAGGQLAGNGVNTGAFVNLEALFEDNPGMVFKGAAKGDYTRPFKRKSIFSKEAKGTAEKYETDYQRLAERMIKGNFEEYTKRKMYDAMVNSGLAVKLPPGEPRPDIDGKPAVKFQITRRGGAPGQTVIENLWVHSDAAQELRQALNLDGPVRNAALARLASVLNKVQLAGPTDALWHIANMMSSITGSQGGKNLLVDLARKIPGPNLIDTMVRVSLSARDVLKQSPEVLKQISELAQIGAIREERPGGLNSRIINLLDKSGRLVRDNLYHNLVKRGLVQYTEEGRREFVNQLGQYNPRLMGQMEAWFKEAGFSPFVVAGRNFNRMGLRKVALDPGVKGATPMGAAKMRAVEAFGVVATLMAIPAVINSITTGKPQGRPGVALGAIDTGKDDSKGRHITIDPAQWIGLRRGMRLTGMNAVIEGLRQGKTMRDIQKQAGKDIIGGILHPWAGPAVQAPFITATGYTTSGDKESKDPGSYWENFKSAVANLNPILHAWTQKEGKGVGAGLESAALSIGKAAGVKTASKLTAQQQVRDLTANWMDKSLEPKLRHKIELREKQDFGQSDYKDLRKALDAGDAEGAVDAYKKLLDEGKKGKDVFKAMQPYTYSIQGYKHWKPMAGLSANEEARFINSLKPEQREVLNQARREKEATWRKFLEMVQKQNQAASQVP